MHYHIYCNQKKLNTNHQSAIEEFQKRLSAYCETTLHINSSLIFPKDINVHNHDFIYINNGISSYSSEEFATFINTCLHNGKSTLHIIIGYNETEFYDAFDASKDYATPSYLSLTNCNLSTDTKTLLFFEQLYRAYTILQGKTYHK